MYMYVHMHEPCKRQSHLDQVPRLENYMYNVIMDVSYCFVQVRMIEHGREISLIASNIMIYLHVLMHMYYALLLYNV